MNVPLWVIETAEEFWMEVGELEPFPRDLIRPIARTLPLAVVLLPELGIERAQSWLRDEGVMCQIAAQNRPLRACLVAQFGQGIILVDATDEVSERRFSIAHELAHFLHDYWRPRRKAIEHFGEQILPVLDGKRPARADELAHSLLTGIAVELQVHLLERSVEGLPVNSEVAATENDADRLAFELLAPSEDVADCLDPLPANTRQEAARLLVDVYGIPVSQVARYLDLLGRREQQPSNSLLQRLGLLS